MKLSTADADLFFGLMWSLQFYVNRQCQVLSNIDSVEAYATRPMEDLIEVRNALWETPELIESYVAENPDGLPAEELELIRKWERFVSDNFYVFRFQKKHTIFIRENSTVYGVLALHDSLDGMFHKEQLPVMVRAVLLPFKGQIIYDGLLSHYSVLFGKGIRSDLNEIYMTDKQNDRIITTLEPEPLKPDRQTGKKPDRDWRPELAELVDRADTLKGGPPVQRVTFSVLRASARLTQAAANNPDDLDELWKLEQRVRTALARLQTVLDRAER